MNWLKAVGYGILVWAAMFVIACVLIAFKVTNADLMGVIMIIASIIVLWLISKQYKIANMMDGLLVGIVWLIVSAILEYVITVQGFMKGDTSLYYRWSVILGYLLIVIVPAVYGQVKK